MYHIPNGGSRNISTHTLPRRATHIRHLVALLVGISTHTLPRRATAARPLCAVRTAISTHTLPRRATYGTVQRWQFLDISTHTLPRRATVVITYPKHATVHFNSHPPAEGDNKTE